ncbi:hypothetical protein [Streptomyces sp. RerS4]|nr:hypothetical protein [Streptomyces sp. RerS4]
MANAGSAPATAEAAAAEPAEYRDAGCRPFSAKPVCSTGAQPGM